VVWKRRKNCIVSAYSTKILLLQDNFFKVRSGSKYPGLSMPLQTPFLFTGCGIFPTVRGYFVKAPKI